MTNANARTTANLLLAAAGMAAAYVILTKPPLRRLVFRMAKLWLGAYVVSGESPVRRLPQTHG